MKAITEGFPQVEPRNTQPKVYYIPEGKILTPTAWEYLQQRKIKVATGGQPAEPAPAVAPAAQPIVPAAMCAPESPKPKYVNYETGAHYTEKPEHMIQLFGNVLMVKDHPRIHFRDKLGSFQVLVVLDQVRIAEDSCQKLVDDLGNILSVLRKMMRYNVLDEVFKNETIIGLTHAELWERPRNPQKFFGVQYMQLPGYTMGRDYALPDQPRAAAREVEVVVTEAFRMGNKYARKDTIEELDRLSNVIHIMMCMHLAGRHR